MLRLPAEAGRAARLRRLARAEHGEHLLERAVAAGLISANQVQAAREESQDDDWGALDVLEAKGWLSAGDRSRLENDEATDLFATLPPPKTPPPDEALAHLANPDRKLADLILVAQLGRGGTGAVWKAWDRRLGRWVAVKLASAALDSGVARDRFSREAMATARMSHPNIVPIYQAGNEGGRAYIVMPLIEGESLAGKTPGTTRALEMIKLAALAVHYAHQQGIVHRDLKPANLMEDTSGRVVVLDFGLAFLREETSSRLTQAGDVVGTASFMAPEQARGDNRVPGPAIDVYGLGSTLYALVTGSAPFHGPSLPALISQVTRGMPPLPRKLVPGLDPRVEAIITTAMDPDPRCRYPTALALAEDVERVLRGEPVDAAHAARWRRRVRRLPRPSVIAGVLLALFAVVGIAKVTRYHDAQTKKGAMSALRDVGRLTLETALQLRRAGDTRGMHRVLPKLLSAYRRLGEGTPAFAEAEYLMGRTYRALLNEEEALRHQERALELDPHAASSLYERAVLLSQQYGRMRQQAVMALHAEGVSLETEGEVVERLHPGLAQLRQRILADCSLLQQISKSPIEIDAALGILAFHRRKFDEARVRLRRVVQTDPLREEAWSTLALTESATGNTAEAESLYKQALVHDKGYAPYLVGLCNVLRLQRPQAAIDTAVAALELDPYSAEARVCAGGTGVEHVHGNMRLGKMPTALAAWSQEHLDAVIKVQPHPEALNSRGILNRYRGLLAAKTDGDPRPHFERSLADLDAAIKADDTLAIAWAGRGRTLWYRALHAIERGEDGSADLKAAAAAYAEAQRRAPTLATPRLWMAEIEGLYGRLQADEPLRAQSHFEAAESALKQAMSRTDDGWSRLVRGTVRTWQGVVAAGSGEDPLPAWGDAETDLSRSIATLPPNYVDLLARRGLVHIHRALYLRPRQPKQAREALNKARLDFDAALANDPNHVDALLGRARVNDVAPPVGLSRAQDYRERALALQPSRVRHLRVRADGLPL